jgi:alpha-tubulin suppressor-like RCC1 family protein
MIPTIARRAAPTLQRSFHSTARNLANGATRQAAEKRWAYLALAAGGGSLIYWGFNTIKPLQAESLAVNPPLFEKPRPKSRSKEEYRDSISSQHTQTKRSWENPGVYAWGLNSSRVVSPDSDEKWIKSPKRIPFFDAVLLRDLKLDKEFGAAIDEKGNLLQWGTGYAPDSRKPEATLTGQNLQSLAVSDDRIIALGQNGRVFSVPVSRELQKSDPRLSQSSWLWSSSKTSVACRDLTPRLGIGERVVEISGGLEHVMMLTSGGRVFTAAASTKDYPKFGQLGIPGLGWYTRPAGPFDQPHEVTELKGHKITQIAAGDTHSLVLDKSGDVFAFGNNSQGQLGLDLKSDKMDLTNALNINPMVVDRPKHVDFEKQYPSRSGPAKVIHIAAGGENSFFVVDRTNPAAKAELIDGASYDAWGCGRGIHGALGNGKLTHIQWGPTKIPQLSGLFEFNEAKGKRQSIPVKGFQVGQSHVAAIMGNITRVSASSRSGSNDTNWGSDVFFFGNNEHFQLGNGKRANLSLPTPVPALGAKKDAQNDMDIDRLQLTPSKSITFAGRSVKVEQRLECGRQCSAVFSAIV